jgi:anaerobic selenocysteine-containing dehydrogenase
MLRASLGDDPQAEAGLREEGIAFPAFGTSPVQFVDVFPGTPDRRARLVPEELESPDLPPLYTYKPLAESEAFPLALISPALANLISSSLGEVLEGEVPARLAPPDARARGIADGDTIRLWNELGEVVTSARLDPDLRPGVVVLPKGLWSHHTRNGRTANALCPDDLEERAGNACFNDARIQVERLGS